MATEKKVVVGLTVKADGKVDIDALRDSIADFGEAGVKAAPQVTSAFENSERAFEKFENKLRDGKLVTERDVKAIAQSAIILEDQIKESFGSAANAPLALQQALERTQQHLQVANTKVGQFTDALRDNRANVMAAGDVYPGLGNALEALGGPIGTATAKFGMFGAAVSQGWQLGKQFAQSIGTDFQAFEEASRGLQSAAGSITNALTSDGFGAAFAQAIAVVNNLGDTVAGSGKALEGFNEIVQAGVDRGRALAASSEALALAADTHRMAVEGGAQAVALWQQTINSTDPTQMVDALNAIAPALKALSDQTKAAAAEQKALNTATEDAVKLAEATKTALESERAARDLGVESMRQEIGERERYRQALKDAADLEEHETHVKAGKTDVMRDELAVIEALATAKDVDAAQIKRMTDALKTEVELHRDALTPQQQATYDRLIKLASQYGSLDEAGRREVQTLINQAQSWSDTTIKVDEAKRSASNYAQEQRTVDAVLKDGKVTIVQLGEAHGTTAARIESGKKAIVQLAEAAKGTNLGMYRSELDSTAEALQRFTERANAAVTAANALKQATAEAAKLAAAKELIKPPASSSTDRSDLERRNVIPPHPTTLP